MTRTSSSLRRLTTCPCLGALPWHRHERQPVAVGRHQAHRVGPQDEQRAVEEIARVLAGDRELRLPDHLLAARRGRASRWRRRRLGQRRKVLARQRLHPRIEPIGGDLHAVLVFLDPDVGLRQRLDDLVELLRRQRQRPALGHRRVTPAAQAHLQIGRQELDFAIPRLDQHVGENRDGVLALDDALEELQFAQQIRLPNDQFHVVMTSRGSATVRPAQRADPFTV